MVKSSSGISEERLVVRTTVSMGEHKFDIELTLANRDTMEFRMLLGREALMERFIVNPAASFQVQSFTDEEINSKYAAFYKEKTGLKIGLLASNPNLYSNKRIMELRRPEDTKLSF